eukprot:gene13545-21399_t
MSDATAAALFPSLRDAGDDGDDADDYSFAEGKCGQELRAARTLALGCVGNESDDDEA